MFLATWKGGDGKMLTPPGLLLCPLEGAKQQRLLALQELIKEMMGMPVFPRVSEPEELLNRAEC